MRGLTSDEIILRWSNEVYSSRVMGKTSNVTMMNAGIYQFDHEKISKFLLPEIMNIHDI